MYPASSRLKTAVDRSDAGPVPPHRLGQCAAGAETGRLARRAHGHPAAPSAGPVRTGRDSPGFLDALFAGHCGSHHGRLGEALAERIVAGGYPAALARTSPTGGLVSRLHRNPRPARRPRPGAHRLAGCTAPPAGAGRRADRAADQRQRPGESVPVEPPDHPRLRDPSRAGVPAGRAAAVAQQPTEPPDQDTQAARGRHRSGQRCSASMPTALWKDRAIFGQLLETFVFQELRRQASWHEDEISFHHFRDKDGAEVDIVLERGARELAGIEVKAAATVTASDFRGLRKLRKPPASASRQGLCCTTAKAPWDLGTAFLPFRFVHCGRRHEGATKKRKYDAQFKVVFDAIRQLMASPEKPSKKIGFQLREKRAAYGRR